MSLDVHRAGAPAPARVRAPVFAPALAMLLGLTAAVLTPSVARAAGPEMSAPTAAPTAASTSTTAAAPPSTSSVHSGVQFDSPIGGWRAGDATAGFLQDVHYPAVRVNVPEGTPLAAQIRGRIVSAPRKAAATGRGRAARAAAGVPPDAEPAAATASSGSLATLIVNGVPLPVPIDESGQFARPYAFAAGSNSVELRAAGQPPRRVQFYDTGGGTRARLRIVLSWDTGGTDLDLHVVTPGGGHAWYGERVLAEGGALDVDVTDGYGPEIFATPTPAAGTWHVFVNYYGAGDSSSSISIAQLIVIEGEGTAGETRRQFRVPLRSRGDLQHVVSFGVL